MPQQTRLFDEEPSTPSPEEDAERAAYRERLRAWLRDPASREIEGFPIGEDEDILALSDPPYYTACPNPFLGEIIERWRTERAALRAELGLPDGSQENGGYAREPFAADVSEGKNDPIYNAHSYHTKVPHKAVMRYILHYTDPGDIVFDGFCGTGMTGVAAQLCGDRRAVEELGYRVDEQGIVYDGERPISRLGARKAVLVDLSPAATFIAYNYNAPVDVAAFEREAQRILREVEEECGWMYETWHPHCDHPERVKGRIHYTVWSDVFVCPDCGGEMVFWDVAVDKEAGKVRKRFSCPHCGAEQTKARLQRAWETVYDRALGQTVRRARQVPVLINYSVGKKRYEKLPDAEDLALIRKIEGSDISYWLPTEPLPDGYNTRQPIESHGITHVHHFYTQRNLWFLAAIHSHLPSHVDVRLRHFFRIWFTSSQTRLHKMNRYMVQHRRHVGPLSGTLYISPTMAEISPLYFSRAKVSSHAALRLPSGETVILTQSSTSLQHMPDSVLDYIFLDPPFGGNLMYSELNFLWECWLRVFTNNGPEAVVNDVQHKDLLEYQHLMGRCFGECYRLLKPGRWMTVEFHNSRNSVWNAIQEAIQRAGFVLADVRTLDKEKGTTKQLTYLSAVKQDLIISAYKPHVAFDRRFQAQAGSEAGAWAFVEEHLHHLPLPQSRAGRLEVLAERQPYLLYDRMVAFHIQRGLTVPLGAAEFYAGLRERFPERDGMYFLPTQVAAYDRLRLQAAEVQQLPLLVTDEKTALLWLRQELARQPQTYQEIQPHFLRELHQAGHEQLPELRDLLEENFLQDEAGRWYVPDPNRAQDLERLRERALLREFRAYTEGRGRLKVFRSEAVRAGFRDAWRRRDYATIVRVAGRLPERVLQEDPDLLMYYDNALMRTET